MLVVAKKKTTSEEAKQDAHAAPQKPFRPYDSRLLDAVQAYADEHCYGNRNQAMNRLLEIALKGAGLWPPK